MLNSKSTFDRNQLLTMHQSPSTLEVITYYSQGGFASSYLLKSITVAFVQNSQQLSLNFYLDKGI